METTPGDLSSPLPAPRPGVFRWQKLPTWLIGCVALGLLVAWGAVVARGYAAPPVLFPLIVGAVLGGALVLLMRLLHVGHRPTAWLGALLAGCLAVAGQHYFTFWKVRHHFAQEPEKLGKLRLIAPERVPPEDFWGFMSCSATQGLPIGGYTARGGWVWLAWSLDGLLLLVPAVLLTGATARLPYCNRCLQWYRTTRSGSFHNGVAPELRDFIQTLVDEPAERYRYRLLACQGGCGPTGLVLSGEHPGGRLFSRTVWLDTITRQRVVEILDALAQHNAEEDIQGA